MAQQYYNLNKAAEVLGMNPAEVLKLREQNELRGYRDGSNWKFKPEDVQNKLAEIIRSRKADEPEDTGDDAEDVLLSEVELGGSTSASGSVLGGVEGEATVQADSDLRLTESGVPSDRDDVPLAGEVDMDATVAANVEPVDDDSTVDGEEEPVDDDATVSDDEEPAGEQSTDLEELDLTLDQDVTLEDSQIQLEKPGKGGSGSGSAVDLSEALDDDNLVLGGSSGSGSDITIGGDSGISLVDPADSGLSLEDPIDLLDGGEESLELGEDDMLVFTEDADSESPTQLKTDDDFLLTPMADGEDGDDSESGSQVIALDSEGETDEGATMVAGAATGAPDMAAMLDEDFAPDEVPGAGGAPLAAAMPAVAAAAAPGPQAAVQAGPALPEAPYSIWNVLSLTFCVIFLSLTGMMLYDLLRNMWSWSGSYDVNSSLMDMILGMIGG